MSVEQSSFSTKAFPLPSTWQIFKTLLKVCFKIPIVRSITLCEKKHFSTPKPFCRSTSPFNKPTLQLVKFCLHFLSCTRTLNFLSCSHFSFHPQLASMSRCLRTTFLTIMKVLVLALIVTARTHLSLTAIIYILRSLRINTYLLRQISVIYDISTALSSRTSCSLSTLFSIYFSNYCLYTVLQTETQLSLSFSASAIFVRYIAF